MSWWTTAWTPRGRAPTPGRPHARQNHGFLGYSSVNGWNANPRARGDRFASAGSVEAAAVRSARWTRLIGDDDVARTSRGRSWMGPGARPASIWLVRHPCRCTTAAPTRFRTQGPFLRRRAWQRAFRVLGARRRLLRTTRRCPPTPSAFSPSVHGDEQRRSVRPCDGGRGRRRLPRRDGERRVRRLCGRASGHSPLRYLVDSGSAAVGDGCRLGRLRSDDGVFDEDEADGAVWTEVTADTDVADAVFRLTHVATAFDGGTSVLATWSSRI